MKKLLTFLLCLTLTLTMMPSLAFADGEDGTKTQPEQYGKTDWITDNGYGSVEGSEEVYRVKGAYSAPGNDGGYAVGPYAKKGENFIDGKIVQEINIAVNVEDEESYVTNGVKFTLSSALNNVENEYTCEASYTLQKTEKGVSVSESNICLTESDIYTFRIENVKKDNNTVESKLTVLQRGKVIGETNPLSLTLTKGEAMGQRYLWISSINPKNGIMVYKHLPQETQEVQVAEYIKSDWTTDDGYGSVEGSDDSYLVKGGTVNNDGYAVGPFAKKEDLNFDNGNIAQVINLAVNVEDEESYLNNGVKFALSSALNDEEKGYTAENTYLLQKTENGVVVSGSEICLTKTDIYTFRIENSRDIFGNVYSQLIVSCRGTEIGRTDKTKLTQAKQAVGQRYLWISNINVKDGIKAYKDVPPYLSLNKTELSMTEGENAMLTATVEPDFSKNKTIEWNTSDGTVATVENGMITAVKSGTATITAKVDGYTATCEVTVSSKSSPSVPPTPTTQKPTIEADANATVVLSSYGTIATITVAEGYELADVVLNGKSLGKVTTVTSLKTGDKLVVTTQKVVDPDDQEAEKNARLKKGVENTTIKLSSTLGKGFIKLNWKKSLGYKVDYYEVYKSTKRYSGYGTEPYYETKQGGITGWYKNTKELKKGTRYYYKVRGVRDIAGETVYTQYSNKAWRLVK